MSRFDIQMTESAKAAARHCASEGRDLRFAVRKCGCSSMAVSIYPDVERATDRVIEIDDIRVLSGKNDYPDLQWVGTIDYKTKGLHKGFVWK